MNTSKIALAFALSVMATLAHADPATVQANAAKVCADKAVHLSDNAALICAAATTDPTRWPRVVKAGDRFVNQGVGAEFNALIRQLPATAASNS